MRTWCGSKLLMIYVCPSTEEEEVGGGGGEGEEKEEQQQQQDKIKTWRKW